jgi:cytochrome c5
MHHLPLLADLRALGLVRALRALGLVRAPVLDTSAMASLRPALATLLLASTLACATLGALGACSDGKPAPPVSPEADAASPFPPPIQLQAETQRAGDPAKGRRALLNEPYVPCGIPRGAYEQAAGRVGGEALPEREGDNASLPYFFTAMKTKDGVDLVTSNCLQCHAGYLDGKLVIGLGNHAGDFTEDRSGTIEAVSFLVKEPKERAEYLKWRERMLTIAPYSVLSTVGPNPADSFTAVLFAHHDPKTMAWLSEPAIPLLPPEDLPVDVPAWWTMKKRTSMFRNGAGRGDHARIMMTASILCTSSVEESRAIDAYFPDVRAFITSLEAPKWPWAVDPAKASDGRAVFERTCSRCHGTYGPGGSYPNTVVATAEVGTDAVLAETQGTAQFAGPFVDWFKTSFFGELARLEPNAGYLAPPLDGVWATAPYFHNGSVPTLAAVIDSTQRPTYWTRSFDSRDYDVAAAGWKFTALDHGKAGEADDAARRAIYDTTLRAYGNGGHTYGDGLSAADRAALLVYLETL